MQLLILRLKSEESFKLTIENEMVIAETGTPVYYRRSLEFDFQKNSHSRAGKDNQDFRITCQAGRVLSKLWSRKNIFSYINM